MNTADMAELVRDNINEASASTNSDLNILRRLNMAQRKLAIEVAQSSGNWLVKSADVTPVASVITLPADCSKPIYLEETTSGQPLSWLDGGVGFRRVSRAVGTTLTGYGSGEAYPLLATIEVNQPSYTTGCTLWYQIRVPDLHWGYAVAGAASSLTFDTSVTAGTTDAGTGRELRLIADYYNGSLVEVIDGTSGIVDIRSEISDYASSVAVITGTPAANDIYGTISRLPEETHMVIVAEATMLALMKPGAQLDKDAFNHYKSWYTDLRKECSAWLSTRVVGSGHSAVREMY